LSCFDEAVANLDDPPPWGSVKASRANELTIFTLANDERDERPRRWLIVRGTNHPFGDATLSPSWESVSPVGALFVREDCSGEIDAEALESKSVRLDQLVHAVSDASFWLSSLEISIAAALQFSSR